MKGDNRKDRSRAVSSGSVGLELVLIHLRVHPCKIGSAIVARSAARDLVAVPQDRKRADYLSADSIVDSYHSRHRECLAARSRTRGAERSRREDERIRRENS